MPIISQNTIFDSYLFGGTDQNGAVKEVWGKDALTNSLRMWIASFKNEILRTPGVGGDIIGTLTKPMNTATQELLKISLIRGLERYFQAYLQNTDVQVTPDYEKRMWKISIKFYSPSLKDFVEFNENLKQLT